MFPVSIFGGIFAGLAEVGKPHLTFACNAGVAVLAVFFLSFSRFPPAGSTRVSDEEDEEHLEEQQEIVPGDGK